MMLFRASLNSTAHLMAGAVFEAFVAAVAASAQAKRRESSVSSIYPTSGSASDSGTAQGGID